MPYTDLPRKPLVEAIFEIQWELEAQKDGSLIDPYYKMLVGQYMGEISADFPVWVKLPAADAPEQVVPHLPQHQFRSSENAWPLIQIGPGILTVNDTEKYKWENFSQICENACKSLASVYPDADKKIKITAIKLRYLNADHISDENPYNFLKKLKVEIYPPEALFIKDKVSEKPAGLNLQMMFETISPKGSAYLKVGSGKSHDKPAIIWETGVVSLGDDAPNMSNILEWLGDAHNITHNWFVGLTEGELLEKYNES